MLIKELKLAPPYSRDENTNNMKVELNVEFVDHAKALLFFIELNKLVQSHKFETSSDKE